MTRSAPLAGRDPVAKLAAAFVLSAALLASTDPVTPSVALVAELTLVPAAGVRWADLARRGWPLLVAAATVALVNGWFAGDLAIGAGLGLRVLAIGLPGFVVFASIDPTDLADSLVQHVRVPARFAVGALAAFRLVPLLAADWRMLRLARRARGVDAGRNPAVVVRLFAGTTFALLVAALRRGERLATAMDARGFDAGVPRSTARPRRFGGADWLMVAGGAAIAAIALAVSVAVGAFRPLFFG